MKLVLFLFLSALLVSAAVLPIAYVQNSVGKGHSSEEFFFGVTYGSNTTVEAKLLIDKVKDYTNLFIVDSWDISTNETALTEICNYAVAAGMSIIVYYDFVSYVGYPWLETWLNTAKDKWGDKFLGIYLYDEPGGNQIDTGQWRSGDSARDAMANSSDYSDAANRFVTNIPASASMQRVKNTSLPVFTSDYALYWFDYLAGYDTIFVELGWNISTTQQIALCRGAANVQGKDWGAIITWTYYEPPYIASGPEIYQEMVTAYSAGAKYVIVFDYPRFPETNPYGILTEEHFTAMRQFWNYVQAYPRGMGGKVEGQVALVLPKDYGWGSRRSQHLVEDRIWGFWPEDEKTLMVGENMNKLMSRYGLKLDIVFDDSRFDYKEKYSKIYFWNSTIRWTSIANLP
jgi:hypothetical protein